MDESQALDLKKMLKRYEGKKINEHQSRILLGILSKNFGK